MQRDAAKWLAGPISPSHVEWILKYNGIANGLNGCFADSVAETRRRLATLRNASSLRLRVLDNGEMQEWARAGQATHLHQLARACVPGVPFLPLKEREVRISSASISSFHAACHTLIHTTLTA
jgi:hypothetical protein